MSCRRGVAVCFEAACASREGLTAEYASPSSSPHPTHLGFAVTHAFTPVPSSPLFVWLAIRPGPCLALPQTASFEICFLFLALLCPHLSHLPESLTMMPNDAPVASDGRDETQNGECPERGWYRDVWKVKVDLLYSAVMWEVHHRVVI